MRFQEWTEKAMKMSKELLQVIIMPVTIALVGYYGSQTIADADRQVKVLEIFGEKIVDKDPKVRRLAMGILSAVDVEFAAPIAKAVSEAGLEPVPQTPIRRSKSDVWRDQNRGIDHAFGPFSSDSLVTVTASGTARRNCNDGTPFAELQILRDGALCSSDRESSDNMALETSCPDLKLPKGQTANIRAQVEDGCANALDLHLKIAFTSLNSEDD